MRIHKLILFLFLTILLIFPNKDHCQIFPERTKTLDDFFPDNNQNEYLYSAGYFTSNPINPYIKRQGITLTKDSTCTPSTPITIPNPIPVTDTDLGVLYSNSIKNPAGPLTCKFPVSLFTNPNYFFTIWIMLLNESGVVKTAIISAKNGINVREICRKPVNGSENFQILVSYIGPNDYQLSCQGVAGNISVDTLSEIQYEYLNLAESPSISFYVVKLIANAVINYTADGTNICKASNPCLEGYGCVGGACLRCHYSCRYCDTELSESSCKTECSKHSLTETPTLGRCQTGYIDLSQFDSIEINTIDPPRTNRVTLAFWFFISDIAPITGNRVFNVVVNDYLMISIGSRRDATQIDYYCHVRLKLNPIIFETWQNIPGGTFSNNVFISAQGKWLYVKCGISYDHTEYFLYSNIDGTESTISQPLAFDLMYGTRLNTFMRTFYRKGDYLTLKINNVNQLASKVYIRNIFLFKEYLPDIDTRYYNLNDIIGSSDDFPELLYVLPLQQLTYNRAQYSTPSKSFSAAVKVIDVPLNPSRIIDLNAPKNFKKLNLHSVKNIKFSSNDLHAVTSLSMGVNDFLDFDDNRAFSCNPGYWVTAAQICRQDCDPNRTSLQGIHTNKGICGIQCAANMKCMSSNSELLNRKVYSCLNTATDYPLFYSCYGNAQDKIFYYNGRYQPDNMIMDLSSYNYDSYMIDLWFFPDSTGFHNNNNALNYLFYFNALTLSGTNTAFTVTALFGGIPFNNVPIVIREWNHLLFNVYYDITTKQTECSFVLNHQFDNPRTFILTNQKQTLTKIYFCNGDPSNCEGKVLNWGSAFYRDLRVWNGNTAQPFITKHYDLYYTVSPPVKIDSIVVQYPLNKNNISGNRLAEKYGQFPFYISRDYNPWDLQQFNYAHEFDTIQVNNILGNTFATGNQTACSAGCGRCFSNTLCYKCLAGFFLNGFACSPDNGLKVLKTPSPSLPSIDYGLSSNSITVTLWVKAYGFTNSNTNMIFFSDNFKLAYSTNDINYGLNLIFFRSSAEQTLSRYIDFRTLLGKWTFISIAYYNSAKMTYFPPMLKFEVDKLSFPIIGNIAPDLQIDKLVFDQNFYALIKNVKLYDNFLVGAYAYEKNAAWTATRFIRTYFAPANPCRITEQGITYNYNCESDLDARSNPNVFNSLNQFINYDSGTAAMGNCDTNKCTACYFSGDKSCSCSYLTIANIHPVMLLGNTESNYCYKLDFVNFAKTQPIRVSNVDSATNRQLTMNFWVYAYSYVDNTFGGITFDWENNIKIEVIKDVRGTSYLFKCSVSTHEESIPFKMSEWNFLHCSVDYINSKFYINTYETASEKYFGASAPPGIANPLTTFTITDNTTHEDWGVLFFRQIRLWREAFYSSSFLAKINIITANKFPGLLHQWNPAYDNTGTALLNDLVKGGGPFRLNVLTSIIGANVVDETKYSIFDFCKEEGEFFDVKVNRCVTFVDLSKKTTNPITINNIYVSYSKSYTIAFWLFLETESSLTRGITIRWSNHMLINIIYRIDLQLLCFPQYYNPYNQILDNIPAGQEIIDIKDDVLNYADDTINDASGKWQWVICSSSYYSRHYYLNAVNKSMKSETVYDNVDNDAPLGNFFNDAELRSSTLSIDIRDITNKIYFRSLYLFKDYLPQNYNFKYMDLIEMPNQSMSFLTLAINFARFVRTNAQVQFTYLLFNELNQLIPNQVLTLTIPNTELSSNFVYLPLCNPRSKEKYDATSNLCVEISACNLLDMNAQYCMEENTPLICLENNYLNFNTNGTVTCESKCPEGSFRTPGSYKTGGICGTKCLSNSVIQTCPNQPDSILTFENSFKCKPGYDRIDYQCYDQLSDSPGSFYYSSCNSPINIHHNFDTVYMTNVAKNGYVIEFWFMIDNALCARPTGLHHYFYAKPHAVYYDAGNFRYSLNSQPPQIITDIHQYEWNKILIFSDFNKKQTELYANFIKVPITTVTAGSLNLVNIAFCSKAGTPACAITVGAVEWGSAYYRNFRIWNFSTATFEVIQAFNTKNYQNENPFSLIFYYPFSIATIDNNVIHNIITGKNENIAQLYNNPNRVNTADNILMYNYSSKFDWGLKNQGNYVLLMTGTVITGAKCHDSCLRCYETEDETKCYECADGFSLIEQTCFATNFFYLKTPSPSGSEISLLGENSSGDSYTGLSSFTMTFWLKFYGLTQTSTSNQAKILSLHDSTFLAYDKPNNWLVFSQSSVDAFVDNKFNTYFGQWIPIVMADYISGRIKDIYPNMFTLSVNRIDIPFYRTYTIPTLGIPVTKIAFGSEIIAQFADLRIYNKFIQGGYGKIMATKVTSDNTRDLFLRYPLTGNSDISCLSSSEMASVTDFICVEDYSLYLDSTLECNNDAEYFNPINNPRTCDACHADCTTLCFNGGSNECTCDMTEGRYWLRRTNRVFLTYCENIPYLDFSNLNVITLDAPMSATKEFTMEFWVFIYSYNKMSNFKKLNIEWSLQNKIELYDDSNSLKMFCYPLYDSDNPSKYTEKKPLTLGYYKWNYIKCGTDLLNRKYFLGSVMSNLNTPSADFPADGVRDTKLKIYQEGPSLINFGHIFIRDLKLWQQYNYEYIDTSYITITTFNIFPGLLAYYQNNFDGVVQMVEEVSARTIPLTRHIDYIGYNIVDPLNEGLTSLITFCSEGEVYDLILRTCVPLVNANCLYVGTSASKCIACQLHEPYIVPATGTCVTDCPPLFFPNPNMNQCRPCHSTCYRCTDRFFDNCTECTGSLFFNFKDDTCIPNCEAVGLTKSTMRPNVCILFEADASLVNVDTITPIDINTFTHIEARVFGATSTGYTTKWGFDVDKTNALNGGNLKPTDTPFADLTLLGNLRTPLEPSFFQLGHKYYFYLEIIKENLGEKIVIEKSWVLTMNKAPESGFLKIIPPLGLHKTTIFIMTCYNWTDENTVVADLEYQFYYVEKGTSSEISLSTWSSLNEVYSNFTVTFYQLETTSIDVYCQIRDQFGAVSKCTKEITIVNDIFSPKYNLTEVLSNYDLLPTVTDLNFLARSEFLKSIGINPYRELMPSQYFITYEPSLEGSVIEMVEPKCVDDYCNRHGECDQIDTTIACYCEIGFVSNTCHLDKTGFAKLATYYQELFDRLMDKFLADTTVPITQNEFKSIYNLFFSAQTCIQDSTYFTVNLPKFLTYMKTHNSAYVIASLDNLNQFVDFFDFYYTYMYNKMNQVKLTNKKATNSVFRNVTLEVSQVNEYKIAFKNIHSQVDALISFIITEYQADYDYKSPNMKMYIRKVTPTFNDTTFFDSVSSNYNPKINFMDCLKDDQSRKGNAAFSLWMIYIEYITYPYSYDFTIYPNATSPFITLRIAEDDGKEVKISDCTEKPIIMRVPFNSYTWISYLNRQKSLFDPKNYKSPDDRIFKDPIYIDDKGYVSDDTIDKRIEIYNRLNNISCLYYIPSSDSFSTNGLEYMELNQITNYIIFSSQHLSSFTTMFVLNDAKFVVDNRFFYVTKFQLFKYWPNYQTSYAFITFCVIFVLYVFVCLIFTCKDSSFFKEESQLEFLKKEIVKSHFPYSQDNGDDPAQIIPKFSTKIQRNKNIRHMFDNVNFDDSDDHQIPAIKEKEQEILTLNDNDDNRSEALSPNPEKASQKEYNQVTITSNRFLTRTQHDQTNQTNGNLNTKNNYFADSDKTKPKLISLGRFHDSSPIFNKDDLPEDLGNEEEERAKALEAYSNLNCSTLSFIKYNIKHRHTLMSPFLNLSLFNPRWKKLLLLVTQIYLDMLLISVVLTAFETIHVDTALGYVVLLSVLTALASNLVIYILCFFFITSTYQRRRLLNFVVSGGQLIVLKAWEKMQRSNGCYTFIGFVLIIAMWFGSFCFSMAFVAVWKVQALTWLIALFLSVFFDLVVFELLIELLIGCLFSCKKKSGCMRNFGESMNRIRSYRTLWP